MGFIDLESKVPNQLASHFAHIFIETQEGFNVFILILF